MSKQVTKDLFNIYDMIVFEDELGGISQDCVRMIGQENAAKGTTYKVVDCSLHSISIYDNGTYVVWQRDGINQPWYHTHKKIIHIFSREYTNDNRYYEIYPDDEFKIVHVH